MVINTAKWSTPVAIGASVAVGVGSFAAMYYFSSSQRRDCDEVAMLELIKRRRSVFPKQYSDKLVDRKVLEEMLEAARWAPTHNITEPWKFVVFSSSESRTQLGKFLADQYKETCVKSGYKFSEAKYKKKAFNSQRASFVVALLCDVGKGRNPPVEEICSVAMAVQNMHLVATAHGVGAYWSSSAVYDKTGDNGSRLAVVNPRPTRDFLELTDSQVCLGWMFVGSCDTHKWPQGRRKELEEGIRLTWK